MASFKPTQLPGERERTIVAQDLMVKQRRLYKDLRMQSEEGIIQGQIQRRYTY